MLQTPVCKRCGISADRPFTSYERAGHVCESFIKTKDRLVTAPRLQLSPGLEEVSQHLRVDSCGLHLLDVEGFAEEDGPGCVSIGASVESGENSLRVGVGREDLFDDEPLHRVVEDDNSAFVRGGRVGAVGRGVDVCLLEDGAGTWHAGKIGPGRGEGRRAGVVSRVAVIVAFDFPRVELWCEGGREQGNLALSIGSCGCRELENR